MRIAQLAPPWLPVPPNGYGGVETVISQLTEALVARGHEVTLFASGDSTTSAHLVSVFPKALGNSGIIKDDVLQPLLHYQACFERAGDFDIIHSHAQFLGLFFARLVSTPVVHTWHRSYYPAEEQEARRAILTTFAKERFVTISHNQQKGLPGLGVVGTVYNGIDLGRYPKAQSPKSDYLLWVGRIAQKKGPLDAIEIAKHTGLPLVMAGVIDPIEQSYFEKEIAPHIDGKNVVFHGELTASELASLYGNALCTLFPIHWHEPFGLVMVESMACGTPVVGYDIGSVSEIVSDGATGFVIGSSDVPDTGPHIISQSNMDGMVEAVKRIGEIDRTACRVRVEMMFQTDHMTRAYEEIYQNVIGKKL